MPCLIKKDPLVDIKHQHDSCELPHPSFGARNKLEALVSLPDPDSDTYSSGGGGSCGYKYSNDDVNLR